MINILLADDHNLVREGIKSLLEKYDDFTIVGEAATGHEAISQATKLNPDVILMDINMPSLNGILATAQLQSLGLNCQVIILSMYSDESLVRQALIAGAQGYVLKRSLTDELILAIRSAYRGETFISPNVSRVLLDIIKERESQSNIVNPVQQLTPREREVMQLIAEGNTTKSIAHKLSVSDKTIEKHRTNLMGKLGVNDIAGVVRMAVKYGVIFIDE